VSLADFMVFRSRLAVLDPGHGREAIAAVSALMAAELGWTGAEQVHQMSAYDAVLARETAFMQAGRQEGSPAAT